MKVCFFGKSHAAQHLSEAAAERGFKLCGKRDGPELIFISEDTPTDAEGHRDLDVIRSLIADAVYWSSAPIVLTSAVPPGFCRSLQMRGFWHQAEILRIKDAEHRARHPEQLIVGSPSADKDPLPEAYENYLYAWKCAVHRVSYEEAEFAKLAINVMLAAQVDATNRLAAAAKKVGARWFEVATTLKHDRRIGPFAYLEPGRWQDSSHLLRDDLTLREIEAAL